MMSGTAHPQMLGAPLVSTSAGGIVSGTNIYSKTTSVTTLYSSGNVGIGILAPNAKLDVNGAISATQLAVPGTWCGMRAVNNTECSSAAPSYGNVNIPCSGTAITGACTYTYIGWAGTWSWVLNTNTINCPAGYTGLRLATGNTVSDTSALIYSCVKN
jgi:hypothetical protein